MFKISCTKKLYPLWTMLVGLGCYLIASLIICVPLFILFWLGFNDLSSLNGPFMSYIAGPAVATSIGALLTRHFLDLKVDKGRVSYKSSVGFILGFVVGFMAGAMWFLMMNSLMNFGGFTENMTNTFTVYCTVQAALYGIIIVPALSEIDEVFFSKIGIAAVVSGITIIYPIAYLTRNIDYNLFFALSLIPTMTITSSLGMTVGLSLGLYTQRMLKHNE